MTKPKIHRDGWATVQVPTFVSGPAAVPSASPQQKQQEADGVRSDVDAFLSAGGTVEVLPTVNVGRRKRRQK